jgi:hypothetical protein
MTVHCDCGREIDVPEQAVVSEAARVYAGRRKRRGRLPQAHSCPWCGCACEGRTGLFRHIAECSKAGALEAWTPDAA